jgi:predicted  nucleic acid-binding Zn-ribbon protein
MRAVTNEEFQKLVLEKLSGIESKFDNLESEVSGLKSKIGGVETRFDGLEEQVKENTNIIKAVRHNQEFGIAKLEALVLNTASKESIVKLDAKFDVLNDRLFQQEADLKILKAVK